MRRLYLVRHAQTAWNGENRLQGRSDRPLSRLGEEQARRLGARFAVHHLRAIVTSALQRSRQTAQRIASGNGHAVQPVIEPELAEMHLGTWEGLTPEDIDARFDGAYQQWRIRPSAVVIPGAEPLEVFRGRVRRVLTRVVAALPEGESVVVSHGGVIAAALADLLGADYDALLRRLRLDNAGVTALEFGMVLPHAPTPNALVWGHVLWINSTTHLD
jgi:probable phosphoglycerate mutase